MNQKLIFATLFLTSALLAGISIRQTQFELPQNIELKTKEDYAKYEKTLVDAATWLEQTDLDKEADKRQQINAFILNWIMGSPTVDIDLNEPLKNIYGKNAQLLTIYLASYGKNIIENRNVSSKFTAAKAGIISIMNVYKKGIQISKSKEMNRIMKLTDSDLDKYIAEKFKKSLTLVVYKCPFRAAWTNKKGAFFKSKKSVV